TDRPRPAVPSFRGAGLAANLPPALETRLRELARRERATPFIVLAAPLCALLARLAATEDVVLGTVVMGRNRASLEDLIGFFVNTLVLRFDVSGDPDGHALLARSREVVLGAFGHQALPFEKLVDELGLPRDPYRPPLLRALFQLLPAPPQAAMLPGLVLEPYRLSSETSKFDLVINTLDRQDRLEIEWRDDADLFDPDTIARWAGSFEVLLDAWLRDPAARLGDLPLLTEAQRHQLLTAWNPEPSAAGRGRQTLPALFEAQVDRAPEAPAVSCGGESLTYRELDERANRLARRLADAGVVPGGRVALSLDRSLEMIVALLAVLKTGAAYVPLDPAAPAERRAFALEDSGAALVLDAGLLEREAEAIARQSGGRLGLGLDPDLPAYVIYTSGSTGRPKGVIIPHGHVARLFSATEAWFEFGPEDVWTLFHSYAFDFSVWEIWGALLYGGRLVVVPWAVSRDPAAFLRLLREEQVTVLNQTPSAFRQLEPSTDLSLRLVLFGGEALDPTALAPWFVRCGDACPRLVNMYGITETTVHVTWRPLTRADLRAETARPASRIGQPIPDLTLHVLDRFLEPQPLGIPGEICVGGAGLAPGYLGRPDLTAARFVPDPQGPPGARLYRSGDLARRRLDGDVEYLGRIDHQVKIRGFRIELGEIEAALAALPGVREAVVLARSDKAGGERRLAGYVTAGPEGAPTLAEMREALGRRLPDYMIPSALVVLDRLPLTANGKVDRGALPAPDAAISDASGRAHVPPRDALEAHCAGLFRQVLKIPEARAIGALDDFFELGGTSISGAILVNRIQETLGEIVHVVAIFDHPTVEALAAYVRDEHPAAAARLWGLTAEGVEADEAPAGPAELEELRRLIVAGRPEAEARLPEERRNPPAVFLLSPPRSGSTLLRVLLGAHPRLFAPPELELLSFQTLAGRQAAFPERDRFWLDGGIRAVMEARACDAAEAERIVAAAADAGWTTRRFYRELQGWIGGRLLVDKTPSYALDPEVLCRAEAWFAEPRYVHLLRHPQATNRSFEEARLDQIFFRRPHSFSRRQLAELIWTASHRNVLGFLAEIPSERKHAVRFEELVRDPERVLRGVCAFLGIDYAPAMADPYRAGAVRMADGPRAESRMLGDVKFHTHGKVDAAAAERWRQAGEAPLGAPARELAAELGYAQDVWEEGGEAPVSFAQERLWLLDQLLPGTPAYNIPGAIRLRGALDRAALARAVDEIVRRHAALRTVFTATAGQPVQRIEAWRPRPLPCADLSGLPVETRDAEVRRLAAAEAARPFDLARGPLFRVALLLLGPREHVALFAMHHIVSDGWSMGVFYREVGALYAAFAAGRPSPLAPLPLQVPDFALRQRSRLGEERMARDLAWWQETLAGLEPLDLPTDRPRTAESSGRGAATPLRLRQELAVRLTALGRGERATLYMVLFAAFATLLHRLTGQDDLAVGTPVANRTEEDAEGLIGFFVNTLVLRAGAGGAPTFRGRLARVRRTVLDAFLHQGAPFERVVEAVQPERQLTRTPLFQVMFALQPTGIEPVALPGLTLEWVEVPTVTAKLDLSLTLGEGAGGLGGAFEHSTDLFDGTTIQRLAGHFEKLAEGLAADPDRDVWDVPLLAPEESHQVLVEWNDTGAALEREPRLLHQLVEEQAERAPGAVALEAGGVRLTYAELVERTRREARRLREQGIGPGSIVALAAERSPELIVRMLAVLQVGAAYLPVDPAYPAERRAFMVEDAGAVAVKDSKDTKDFKDESPSFESLKSLRSWASPESPAYLIYTSGSTGRPKGVVVPHRAIASFVRAACATYALTPADRILQFASISFDTSAEEIWPALASGATLVLRSEEMAASIAGFLREVERLAITVLDLPTAFWHEMVAGLEAEGLGLPRGLRLVILGGEEAQADRLALWRKRAGPSVRLVNT
ncbi:MAG TPA: amino acid adenylation domain-containing protein, partial [Thermoanaerobaculia bacterium]|nr:amino acid adenylation domain-containing protein [Thermoanaerobaculia bacterium]